MGFMDISIGGSDMASDFCSSTVEKIRQGVLKELKNEANVYNTPGYINVALLLESLISKENEFHFTYEDWLPIWETLKIEFENYTPNYNNKSVNKQYKELSKYVLKMYNLASKQLEYETGEEINTIQ